MNLAVRDNDEGRFGANSKDIILRADVWEAKLPLEIWVTPTDSQTRSTAPVFL